MEDNKILELYFARDEDAICQTALAYGGQLKRLADNILHSEQDTQECVSDTYLRAWNTIPPQRPTVLKYYLSRIIRNQCFKRIEYLTAEKRSCNATVLLSELEECIPDGRRDMEEILEVKELVGLLNRFLGTLESGERQLFIARYYYAMTVPQLAEKYGCSQRQVKYRLGKIRKELKRIF